TPRKSKRGYNASARVRVPHVSKYAGLSLDGARRLHEGRSPVAQGTDEGLKAPLAGSPGEWAANMNRLDLRGVDDPKEKGSPREKAEAESKAEPGHRRGPNSLDEVEWELDHLQGVALTRAEKAEGNSGNFEDYYDPLDRAYQQELLAARKRLMEAGKEHPEAEAPSSRAGVSREVAEEWRRRGEEAAEEYNAIISRNNREHRRPTPEETHQMNRLKETVSDANRALKIYETQPKGPRPRAGRGFREEATLIDAATGAVVATSRGERHNVKIQVPKTGTYKMSHTHPTDTPHSVKDVHLLISNDRLREMQVQTPNRTYTLRKTEKTPSAYIVTRIYGRSPAALSRGANAKHRKSDTYTTQEDLIRNIAKELHLNYENKEK
ncbi:MAG: hypothetical protein Q8O76_11605, partial [Chloroflexota bacterium]|nr:hypothetical protein [Chloroflexota bacterium]